MPFHELFRKILAAFQLCAFLSWTNKHNMFQLRVIFEEIPETFNQRLFGPNNHHTYFMGGYCIFYGVEILQIYLQVSGDSRCAGIAWSTKKGGKQITL
ncbi:hypothetical protein SDC9_202245 [bioreactor metagenome]|uniref:Uncharacterized protein n=1 Tax=bioreactor metagenome TaxID=1076179 RepID=A0A645J248_9ZZZZ